VLLYGSACGVGLSLDEAKAQLLRQRAVSVTGQIDSQPDAVEEDGGKAGTATLDFTEDAAALRVRGRTTPEITCRQ
jgi:hypothetical protein